MTGLYLASAAERIKHSLGHEFTVTIDPAFAPSFTLPATDVKVTFAEDWAPHIQAQITAPIPAQAQLDGLDSRRGCRVIITAGYRYPDGTVDVQHLADLGLRSCTPSWPDNTISIDASSDEALAMDRMRVEANTGPLVFDGINEAVQFWADYAVYPSTADLDSPYSDTMGASALVGFEVETGTPMWSPIEDAAARCGVWVYCTGERQWRIAARPELGGTVRHTLAVGEDGTIITAQAPLDRTQWANQVVTEYTWTDGDGAQQTVYGRAAVTSGPFSVNTAGYRSDKVTYERPATQAQADAPAGTRVRQLVTRGRGLSLEAHAAYWLRPGHTTTVQLPLGAAENHIVRSITFDLGVGKMAIQTRQPLDVTITTGE